MKTILKLVGALVGILVLLIVAAIIIIPTMFDPNDYKTQIVEAVKKNTGRDLRIDGDLSLTVFPWLGVTAGVIELGNAPGFEAPLFARTEKVAARVKLLPLLERQVEMDTVTVHGLTLNLEKNADGKSNWEDLSQSPHEGEADTGKGDGKLAALAIGGLDVQNANLNWSDRQAGQSYHIANLSITTGALTPGKPIDFALGFDVTSAQPKVGGRVTVDAEFNMNEDTGEVIAKGLELVADLKGDGLPGGEAKVTLSANVNTNTLQHTANISDLELDALGLEAKGALQISDYQNDPKLSGALSVSAFDLKALMKQLALGELVTADSKALTKVSFDTQITGSASAIGLNPMTAVVDDSALSGQVTLGKTIQFVLALDQIDADRYLPPKSEGTTATPGAAAGGAGQIPSDQLRGLDIDGKFTIGKLTITKLNVSDISLSVQAKNGLITLNPIAARLYDGTYAGNITLDATGETPKLAINEKLTGIQAGPLLSDLQGNDQLSGTGNVEAQLTARGTSPEAMKQTLNGSAAFSFTDGAIKGINIPGMIRAAKAKLFGGSAGASGAEKTDFSELSGTIDIKDGLATNNDLSMKSPLLRIAGAGNAHLAKETIDYKATTTVVATTEGQGGDDLKELAGIPIPIKISGTFADPKYGLDFEALASAVAKSKAADLLEGGAGKLIEGGVEGAGGLIEGGADGLGEVLEGGAEGAGELGKKAADLIKGDKDSEGGLLKGLLN